MELNVPDFSLVVLIGVSGSGKSTFAAKHFQRTEILSSDWCRGLVSDDDNDQSVSAEAFDVLHYIAAKRLTLRRLTVIDATNVDPTYRKKLVQLAREYHALPVAIILNVPPKLCEKRNRVRSDRTFSGRVIRHQASQLRRSLRGLKREGFRVIHRLDSAEDVDAASLVRRPVWADRRDEAGPFDIIGDVHGCFDELLQLLTALGWSVDPAPATDDERTSTASHPDGRRLIFVGDIVDRGPGSHHALKLVMDLVDAGIAMCVPGNHDVKLLRKLRGRDVKLNYGLAETMAQLATTSEAFIARVATFIDSLVSHLWLDGGKLVIAHAGIRAEMVGRGSGKVREFTLYGETTGETDDFGLPIRYRWAEDYRGEALVVYGHTPVVEPDWLNRTVNIDTGCAFGGNLTALRYPERECVAVEAAEVYCEPIRPIGTGLISKSAGAGDYSTGDYGRELNLDDVVGKQVVTTRLHHTVTIREENGRAALEVMSRFAIHPGWLVYLPPTMAPAETSSLVGHLEHPEEALHYYRKRGVERVVCEEKHMGSRAVVVLCRDEGVAEARFGVPGDSFGACHTRTGRRFFNDSDVERAFFERLRDAVTESGLLDELESDWIVLDCELMPWSAKAQTLIRDQYAATAAAGRSTLAETEAVLAKAAARLEDVGPHLTDIRQRRERLERYAAAYRRYCWPVESVDDYRLAPFHVMATENHVHVDRDHEWHMAACHRIAAADPDWLVATKHRVVSLDDARDVESAIGWWTELTEAGGEGMVVKPHAFVARDKRGLLQPAVKSRGREYLRIIYGPDYTAPEQLARLRKRGLSHKRSMALREFALGVEGLERFVAGEPLSRVHQCAFGVLALESEPVDPRL